MPKITICGEPETGGRSWLFKQGVVGEQVGRFANTKQRTQLPSDSNRIRLLDSKSMGKGS